MVMVLCLPCPRIYPSIHPSMCCRCARDRLRRQEPELWRERVLRDLDEDVGPAHACLGPFCLCFCLAARMLGALKPDRESDYNICLPLPLPRAVEEENERRDAAEGATEWMREVNV